ncbi:DUF1611 domain-containing protein [Pseudoalteromonas byunsanensis]|uniref:EBNA-1 nuclear protein n=1 Tax=Pseudoalteromonas byunsanensis TaxID=327939 RepID=A0A1S1N615_9GAMM|nr:DUF1611 domain-containing protein [Pseudoalteromonas byunsanensis]OHU96587.1 EBNA-1 nuclear protein [Pseudoalteromonas byunsanensis]
MSSSNTDNRLSVVSNEFVQPRTQNDLLKAGHYHGSKLNAVIFCEGNFTKTDGKTANGLIRFSPKFRILSVIDSEKAGLDSGYALDRENNGIPIYASLIEAILKADEKPEYFIFGIAPSNGVLSLSDRRVIIEAIKFGMNIVNGLHEYLNDDPEFFAMSQQYGVVILDVRKPRQQSKLQNFSGIINQVDCPRIAVLGTDCAIGKRTTATILVNALRETGLNVVLVATGQTGVMQGSPYSLVVDSIPAQFCPGELEAVICRAYETEKPDVIVIEGQGALSHPAFCTSAMIIRGSAANAVILQHAPRRKYRVDFEQMPMPSLASEIELIEHFAHTNVIGICINHEGMHDSEVEEYIYHYSKEFHLPVTDSLTHSNEFLLHMVFKAFPQLEKPIPPPQ